MEETLATGIIESSRGEWCSPVLLVPKKNDLKLRFCVNFSKSNAVSALDPYPMPRVDELIEPLGKAIFLTILDLYKGYLQVPFTKETKDLTFRVPSGLFHFRVMPIGLHRAPATFRGWWMKLWEEQRIQHTLHTYNIVIFSCTWEEHVEHLADFFQCIQGAGLVINTKKCHIAKLEVQHIGYVISGGGIRPQLGKLVSISAVPIPSTKRRLRSFLGFVGWTSHIDLLFYLTWLINPVQ